MGTVALRSSSGCSYPILSAGALTATLAVREAGPLVAPKPRLLDRVREAIRTRHYSRRTEKAYVHWIKQYIFFRGKRHPAEMGAAEVTAFLTSLAVHSKVAASTQNQALSALLFLYREVLGVELPWLDDVVRAKRPQHLPVALTRDEVRAVLQRLAGVPRLRALLLYGAGVRLLECCRLRVKDVDFATNQIVIRDGKGGKDRVTMLPAAVKIALIAHLERAREQHQANLRHGTPYLPSLVCHPPAGGEPRHPRRPGAARPPGRQHHHDPHPRAQPGSGRSPQPCRPDVPVMTSEAGKHVGLAAEVQVISCSASRCITARERRRALQVRVNAGVDGARPGSFVMLYRTTQPDIVVQER